MRSSWRNVIAALLALFATAAGAVPSAWSERGPLPVRTRLEVWRDAARERDVPLKVYAPDGEGPFPLVIFSHGLGGSREAGTAWGEHWASHGFVSVHLQHPGSDEPLWRDAESRAAAFRAMRQAMSPRQFLLRIEDVRFVIDELARRRAAGDALAKRIDLARIGISGHSFGAQTTLAVAGERFPTRIATDDPRVGAAVAFSPSARGDESNDALAERFGDIRIPFLSVTGTADGDVAGTGATPENRTLPFVFMRPPDKYLLVLNGADHMVFAGQPGVRRPHSEAEAVHYRLTRAVTLAFWRAYLRNDSDARAWLRSPAASAFVGAGGVYDFK